MTLLPGQDQPYGSDAHIDYANARMKAMEEKTGLEWNYDPAFSGHRFRSFPGSVRKGNRITKTADFELQVYEDGRWVIYKGYSKIVGQGEEETFDSAVDSMMLIYRKRVG